LVPPCISVRHWGPVVARLRTPNRRQPLVRITSSPVKALVRLARVCPCADRESGGWGFESLWACHGNPCTARVPLVELPNYCRVAPKLLGRILVEWERCRATRRGWPVWSGLGLPIKSSIDTVHDAPVQPSNGVRQCSSCMPVRASQASVTERIMPAMRGSGWC
jgi:hypothetical protein